MKVSIQSLDALVGIITGDANLSPYRKGHQLVEFFNRFGLEDEYDQNFPSRGAYTKEKLVFFNGTTSLEAIICTAFDPRDFEDSAFDVDAAVAAFNRKLQYDDLVVRRRNRKAFGVFGLHADSVDFTGQSPEGAELTQAFLSEQISKCEAKLEHSDYDGSITNSRSMLEAVLLLIEREFDAAPPKYNGNLPQLYKRVRKHLNLEASDELAESLHQILTGLTSIVHGIGNLRNAASDAHAAVYRPSEHHARLAVNATKTLCRFLLESLEYQRKRSRMTKGEVEG